MSTRKRQKNSKDRAGTRRAEKMSALAALLGPEAMARLRLQDDGFEGPGAALSKDSQDRIAWQRNRLLERLRAQLSEEPSVPELAGEAGPKLETRAARKPSVTAARELDPPPSVDARIASSVDLARLGEEHPAVIVRVLEGLDRAERVAVLKALPGHTARAAIYRLRVRQGSKPPF